MKEKIHPVSKLTTFKCATCGAEYKIMSTCKADVVSIDVCANCHPVFVGKSVETNVKGRAEKLASKFEQKNYQPKVKKVRVKKSNKTVISYLKQNALSLSEKTIKEEFEDIDDTFKILNFGCKSIKKSRIKNCLRTRNDLRAIFIRKFSPSTC